MELTAVVVLFEVATEAPFNPTVPAAADVVLPLSIKHHRTEGASQGIDMYLTNVRSSRGRVAILDEVLEAELKQLTVSILRT